MPAIHVLSYSVGGVLQMLTLQVLFLTAADFLIETDKMEFCMHFKQLSSQKTRCWKWRKIQIFNKINLFYPLRILAMLHQMS